MHSFSWNKARLRQHQGHGFVSQKMHDLILYYECHNVVKVALDKSVSSAMNYHEIFCVGDATRVFAVEPA